MQLIAIGPSGEVDCSVIDVQRLSGGHFTSQPELAYDMQWILDPMRQMPQHCVTMDIKGPGNLQWRSAIAGHLV